LNADAARLLAFDAELGSFFESATAAAGDGVEAKAIANWVTGDLVALAREAELEPTATAATPEALAALVGLVVAGSVNRGGAREVLAVLVRDGGEPAAIVERLDLGASDSGELEAIVEQAIADQPDAAAKVKAGEGKAIGAIVGAVMRETRGKADGGEVTLLIRAKLGL
jgi:aspartyl-tRNA(Asn)/glutamyl-tRNA(Gln) amidotransferase subunit B